MSSILKALKKIEVQPSRSDSFFTMPESIDTFQEKDFKARRRRRIRRLAAIILILLIVFVTAIIFFNQRRLLITKIYPAGVSRTTKQESSPTSAGSNIFRAKMPPVAKKAVKSPIEEARLAKKEINLTSPADRMKETPAEQPSESSRAAVDQIDSKTASTARISRQETPPNLKEPLPETPALKDEAASKKSVAAKSVPSGRPATRSKKPKKTETFDRLDGSRLKLQALAWFIDATKRIAVINDRIVREGESVDGYQVTQIRPQDVVVNDGTKSWRLEFGLKQ